MCVYVCSVSITTTYVRLHGPAQTKVVDTIIMSVPDTMYVFQLFVRMNCTGSLSFLQPLIPDALQLLGGNKCILKKLNILAIT